jgi:ribokinase
MSGPVVVSGLVNLETTFEVDRFPIAYSPNEFCFHRISSDVSGVGYNVARALRTLGHEVRFVAAVGDDPPGNLIRDRLERDRIDPAHLVTVPATPQSVILYERSGRRQSNTDLKDLQKLRYPADRFAAAIAGCGTAVMCNVNFNRPYLDVVRRAGLIIATDIHTIDDLEHPYDRDFMEAADILFMSDERLPLPPAEWLDAVMARYEPLIAVLGRGPRGALLAERDRPGGLSVPAVQTREPIGTIGAGDALFAAFLHGRLEGRSAEESLNRAAVFASYKIGAAGAAQGFLSAGDLDDWVKRVAGAANPPGP